MGESARLDVLVVDDDVHVARTIRRMAPPDVSARCTTSKSRAIELLRDARWPCAVALIDVRLGGERLGGLDVLEVALVERRNVTCVLVTGSSDVEVSRRAFDRDVPVLPKPFTKEQLVTVFARARPRPALPPRDALAECVQRRALEWRLPPKPCEALRVLATYEKRPHEETARALGIALNTLRAHIQVILHRSGLPSIDVVRETLLRDSLSLSANGGPGNAT
jgi:FixJ family two-component response regulator